MVDFDDFGIKIGVMRMTGQVISFITSPIHVPIRRVFTEAKPEDGIDACKAAWFKSREEVPEGEAGVQSTTGSKGEQ